MADRRSRRRRLNDLIGRVARGALPRTPDFRILLADQTAVAVELWEALVEYCARAEPELAERVSELEKKGDALRDRNHRTLRKAFSAGFDRHLTASAIERIDDLSNYGKTTVREMQILGLEPDRHTLALAQEILEGARELHRATLALAEGPKAVEKHTAVVHKHERNIEKQYRRAVAELFPTDLKDIVGDGDELRAAIGHLLAAMRRREIYRHLSNAADRLEAAGRIVRKIAIATV